MSCPVSWHKNTSQIRMTCKRNPEEVVHFAFIPVCTRPDIRHCWYVRMLFTALSNTYFKAHETLVLYREKLVDNIEARYTLGPVNCCDRFEEVILQILFEVCTYLNQILWHKNYCLLILK